MSFDFNIYVSISNPSKELTEFLEERYADNELYHYPLRQNNNNSSVFANLVYSNDKIVRIEASHKGNNAIPYKFWDGLCVQFNLDCIIVYEEWFDWFSKRIEYYHDGHSVYTHECVDKPDYDGVCIPTD